MKSIIAGAARPLRSVSALLLLSLLSLLAPLAAAQRAAAGPDFHPLPLDLAIALSAAEAETEVVDMAMFEEAPDITVQQAQLLQLRQELSPYDPQLAEAGMALGRNLQALERHEEAIAEFERARQVLRANGGLYELQQLPLLDAQLESRLALQQWAEADGLQETRFQLIQSSAQTTPRQLAEASLRLADWQVRRFLQERSDSRPSGNNEPRPIGLQLERAYDLYLQALTLQRTDRSTTLEFLTTIERRIAGLVRLVSDELQASSQNSLTRLGSNSRKRSRQTPNRHLVKDGTSALQRAVAYHLEAPVPDVTETAQRMLELGDWYLLLDERRAAIRSYEEALALLESAELPPAPEALGSGLPVLDPAAGYLEEPGRQPPGYEGYIDVEFEVNRFGKAQRPQILASSTQEPELQKALLQRIRSSTFRPGLAGESVLAQHRVQLRYYFSR